MHTATRGFSLTFRTLGLASDATKYIVPSTYEYRTPVTSGLLAADDVARVQKECRSIARRTSFRCRSSESPPGGVRPSPMPKGYGNGLPLAPALRSTYEHGLRSSLRLQGSHGMGP